MGTGIIYRPLGTICHFDIFWRCRDKIGAQWINCRFERSSAFCGSVVYAAVLERHRNAYSRLVGSAFYGSSDWQRCHQIFPSTHGLAGGGKRMATRSGYEAAFVVVQTITDSWKNW